MCYCIKYLIFSVKRVGCTEGKQNDKSSGLDSFKRVTLPNRTSRYTPTRFWGACHRGSSFRYSSRPKGRKTANNLFTQNRAVPLHPGDWKLAKGIIPIQLNYPAIIGSMEFLISRRCILLRCKQIMLLDMSTKSDQELHDSRKAIGF